MPRTPSTLMEPRKSPIQARSTASVGAILEATLQVLVDVGKERLTTTRVAHRAGVSVGTLYQYFPNKSALLQAALRSHLESVGGAVEAACLEERGKPVRHIATRIVRTFLEEKMKDIKTSTGLYAVSSDVDGARIAQEIGHRLSRSIAAALASAEDAPQRDLNLVAGVIQGAMAGVSRRLLESSNPAKLYPGLTEELVFMVQAYLDATS